MKKKNHSLTSYQNGIGKYKEIILKTIIKKVEKGTGKSLKKLKKIYKEEQLYEIGLYYETTTNKAICEALKIPVEAGTRYKRRLEKDLKLVSSIKEVFCPFTKHNAHLLSTNPDEFSKLLYTNQLRLF